MAEDAESHGPKNPYASKTGEAIVTGDSAAANAFGLLAVAWELRQLRHVIEPIAMTWKTVLQEDDDGVQFTPTTGPNQYEGWE